jgi:hypothetical protein
MATNLLLGEGVKPTNLHLNPNTDKARLVTADMFNIAERIAEISPSLYILELERESAEGAAFGFAIMEHCIDGIDRLVFRASKPGMESKAGIGLDGRVLERLRHIMALSLHDRIAVCDRERAKWEAEQAENALEQLYETMGGEMYDNLHRHGFVHVPKSMSVRPLNRTARRHGRHAR